MIEKVPYFKGLSNFNNLSGYGEKKNFSFEYDEQTIMQFKRKLYEQSLNWKLNDNIGPLDKIKYDIELIIRCYELGRFLLFDIITYGEIIDIYSRMGVKDVAMIVDHIEVINVKIFRKVYKMIKNPKFNSLILFIDYNKLPEEKKSQSTELEMLKKCCDENIPTALTYLAICTSLGLCGIVKDVEKATEIFKQNYEKNNNLESLCFMAASYAYENQSEESRKLGFALLKQNWEVNKCSNSLFWIAMCHLHGSGACRKNEETALQLFEKNWEENRNAKSADMLCKLYNNGIGCKQNFDKALEYEIIYNNLKYELE